MAGTFKDDADSPRRDPADIARERQARIRKLLDEAAEREREAAEYWEAEDETAEHLALAVANNRRLQAMCIQVGLNPPSKEDA